MTTGERIRMLRKEKDMTLEEVAKQIGISRATVLKYETGAVLTIPPDKIEMLGRLFDVSPSYIMGWSEERKNDPGTDLEAVAAASRVPPVGIVVPDNALYVKATNVMSPEELATITEIFSRAFHKIHNSEVEK